MTRLEWQKKAIAAVLIASLAASSGATGLSAVAMTGSLPATRDAVVSVVGVGGRSDVAPAAQAEDDIETLDEGAPPAADAETLDAGATATGEDDIELMDQGAPPAASAPAAVVAQPSAATYVAPVTVDSAPAEPTGPVLPPGFGEGRVHAVAGHRNVPIGLEACQVGAVTGRAYIGLKCGEEEVDISGFAPSFGDFPFVVEDFPFTFVTGEETVLRESLLENDDVVVIAAPARRVIPEEGAEEATAPFIETTGPVVVDLTQAAQREQEPRVRVRALEGRAGRGGSSAKQGSVNQKSSKNKKGKGASASKQERQSARATDDDGQRTAANEKQRQKHKNKNKNKNKGKGGKDKNQKDRKHGKNRKR